MRRVPRLRDAHPQVCLPGMGENSGERTGEGLPHRPEQTPLDAPDLTALTGDRQDALSDCSGGIAGVHFLMIQEHNFWGGGGGGGVESGVAMGATHPAQPP